MIPGTNPTRNIHLQPNNKSDTTSQERIVTAIEQGVLPWRRPWRTSPNAGRPANVMSKRPYLGVNPLLLQIAAMQHGFSSRWWATYRQWSELGAKLRNAPSPSILGRGGERHHLLLPRLARPWKMRRAGEEKRSPTSCCGITRSSTPIRSGGEKVQVLEEPGTWHTQPDFAPAEELIVATGADIRHGGEQAFYSPRRGLHPTASPRAVRQSWSLLRDGPPRASALVRAQAAP